MTEEIARQLIGGEWVTTLASVGGGGGGGTVEEITSDDESVTVTNPTGPTVDLSVSGGSPAFAPAGPFEVTAADIAALFTFATLQTDLGIANADLVFTAAAAFIGARGNDLTVTYENAGPDTHLSASRSGTDITVTLETDSEGVILSTASDVLGVVNATGTVSTRLTAALAPGSSGTGVVVAMGSAPLAGGEGWDAESYLVEIELWTPSEGDLILGNPDVSVSEAFVDFTGHLQVATPGGGLTFPPEWTIVSPDDEHDGYSYNSGSDGSAPLAVLIHVGANPAALVARVFTDDVTAPPPSAGAFSVTFIVAAA